jgi:hypothetical protein
MVIGLTFTGRWTAARMMPPVIGDAAAADPPALGAAALPAVVGAAPLAAGEAALPLHAAMTALIEPNDKPTMLARQMNSRRLRRPAMKASTTSSCNGTAERRTLSNLG